MTLFNRKKRMPSSLFIRPMHPKVEIRPTADAIQKILSAGWVGQLKIHGHRAQIHIPSDEDHEIIAYNRQGKIHRKEIPPEIISELRRIFAPQERWNVIDAEWIKAEDRLYVFDLIKLEGKLLSRLAFLERSKLLARNCISPSIKFLGVLTTVEQCMKVLDRSGKNEKSEKYIEGLVFKSPSPGFEDSSIIRCRRTMGGK